MKRIISIALVSMMMECTGFAEVPDTCEMLDRAVEKALRDTGWVAEYKELFHGVYEHGLQVHRNQKDLYDKRFLFSAEKLLTRMAGSVKRMREVGQMIPNDVRRADDARLVQRLKAAVAGSLLTDAELDQQREYLRRYFAACRAHLNLCFSGCSQVALQDMSNSDLEEILPANTIEPKVYLGGVLVDPSQKDKVERTFADARRAAAAVAFCFAQMQAVIELYGLQHDQLLGNIFEPYTVMNDQIFETRIDKAKILIAATVKGDMFVVDKTLTNVMLSLVFIKNLRTEIDPAREFQMIARPDRVVFNNPFHMIATAVPSVATTQRDADR